MTTIPPADSSGPSSEEVSVATVPAAEATLLTEPAAVAAASKKSILPLLAIIFAGAAFLLAVFPATAGLTWLLAVPAIVLAIIALVKKAQPKLLGVFAIILAPLAWLIAIIVVVATVASGIGNAIDQGKDPVVSAEQPADAEEPAKSAAGTRDNPIALGTAIEDRDWTVVINSVTFGATDAVRAANAFNDAPPEGSEYVLINYTATYTGDDADGQMAAFVSVEYVTPEGNTVSRLDSLAVAPDAIDTLSTLYTGASVTGNMALAIPTANADRGVLAVRPGMLNDKVFVSVK